ncbi:DNA-binding transcriptional MerR regulator [Amorphus suaedae]
MAEPVSAGSDQKGPEAYRTISEVAGDLDLPQHVLRFWETRFGQIKPMKRAGGRRFYRPQDVELLRGIRHLLYSEGLTIRGVQKVLREQGPKHVAAIGRGEADANTPVEAPPPKLKPARFRETADEAQAFFPFSEASADRGPEPPEREPRQATLRVSDDDFDDDDFQPAAYAKRPRKDPPMTSAPSDPAPSPSQAPSRSPSPSPAAAPSPAPAAPRRADTPQVRPPEPRLRPSEEPARFEADRDALDEPLPKGILPEDEMPTPEPEAHHSGFRFLDRLKREPHQPTASKGDSTLSREDVRDLQAALFELLECKRLLDRTR